MRHPKSRQYQSAIDKEMKIISRKEESLRRAAFSSNVPKWKSTFMDKVPEAVYRNLQNAFGKAFALVFEKGTGVIEKTYNRDSIEEDVLVREFAFQVKANRKTLKKARKDAKAANVKNLFITSAEGLGLGILGIGLPDIIMFVGVLLKGIYETALKYGYSYDSDEERYFILKLMETAMKKGDEWEEENRIIDRCIELSTAGQDFFDRKERPQTEDESMARAGTERQDDNKASRSDRLSQQIRNTADAFAEDMVLLKFIQGLPLIGVIGGAGNPLYYNKVMNYAELKYRKRYLLKIQREVQESNS